MFFTTIVYIILCVCGYEVCAVVITNVIVVVLVVVVGGGGVIILLPPLPIGSLNRNQINKIKQSALRTHESRPNSDSVPHDNPKDVTGLCTVP